MRQVQIRGLVPAVVLLIALGALVALVIFASLAVALPVAGALLVLGLARSLWYGLTGRKPPRPVATFRTIRFEPGWSDATRGGPAGEEGPVVDALPRPVTGAERPGRPGEPEVPPGPGGTPPRDGTSH